MSEAFRFDYYYGAESDQFSFVRIPKLLLKDPKFANLSHGAIITYAVLLDRMNLSIKNGWHDEYNRVYIRYKVTDLTDVIGKSDDTVSKYLKELEDIDYRDISVFEMFQILDKLNIDVSLNFGDLKVI